MTVIRTTVVLKLSIWLLISCGDGWSAEITIRFVEKTTKSLTPVRVELLTSNGDAVFAQNSIPLSSDCALAPLPGWLSQPAKRSLLNPFTGTSQHYVNGVGRYALKPGRYQLRAFKGLEYKVAERVFVVPGDDFHVDMERWHDPGGERGAATDVHLHIARTSPDANASLAVWMAAEDLDIANLLQMGALTHFAAAPQYSFQAVGGQTLLVAGQEHPRTHLLGHALSLGGTKPVDQRPAYIQYHRTFEAVKAAGGISGFAHWGAGPSRDGIAVNAFSGTTEILEVLGVGTLYVDTWYQLLNLGFEVAAVAGTDFPCLSGVPGRERTYVQMDQPLSRAGMVASIRQGRTMVTNGPMLKLAVQGHGIGSRLEVGSLDEIRVQGELQFDPEQDAVALLELIHNGDVVRAWPMDSAAGRFAFSEVVSLPASGWLALRTEGLKVGETPSTPFPAWMEAGFSRWMSGGSAEELRVNRPGQRGSYAHTSAIYLSAPGYPRPEVDVSDWLQRLDKLQRLLERDGENVLIWHWLPYSDGVSPDHLRANAPALIEQIRKAKADFARRGPAS